MKTKIVTLQIMCRQARESDSLKIGNHICCFFLQSINLVERSQKVIFIWMILYYLKRKYFLPNYAYWSCQKICYLSCLLHDSLVVPFFMGWLKTKYRFPLVSEVCVSVYMTHLCSWKFSQRNLDLSWGIHCNSIWSWSHWILGS